MCSPSAGGLPPHEVNIQGELYTLLAFIDAHHEFQQCPGEPGCDLPQVVVALMFWSDALHLAMFGNAKLWPVYMYFGNESKYCHCKPSCNLANHVAYFQKVRWPFVDDPPQHWTSHFHELFQVQWKVLCDDKLLEAYEHGIVVLCCDGVKCRFYPQFFTYSMDYPEKVLVATIHQLGMTHDRQQHSMLAWSNASRSQPVSTARCLIYENNYGIDSAAVEALLKSDSWVLNLNTFLDSLEAFGFNVFIALVIDLLYEFELGVWHTLLIHLL
ncbi:hypothetical protein BDR05DRAFT_978786 [Suillus weaverae]|nr:hypothetical protein BDR05DRAFT_978786 [Suillus weaverae]